jgi:sigma-B regulation protein RsbU (phosphoserine phosphatase)
MADKTSSLKRLQISNFKLNSLLEITNAINENLSVEDLLKRYKKILTEELEIGKVIIFKLNNTDWDCIINSGFPETLTRSFNPAIQLPSLSEITFISADPDRFSDEVDIIIPVNHKEKPVAYVLIGDVDEESDGISPIIKHLRFIQTLSNIIIVAIENIRLYNESLLQVAIKREMELASRMQSMLIPSTSKLPWNNKIHFKAFYHPHYDVGGDYYDVIELSKEEIGFCIADVSGKGISAAILMSNFQANLRALFLQAADLSTLVTLLNERVLSSANGEKFITLFIAKYNFNTKELEYINAGHNPPLFYDMNTSRLSLLESGCVGMGMLDEIPVINKEKIIITGPAKILLYTDGLVELIEGDDVGYGYKFIEQEISNSNPIEQNMKEIIVQQRIETGNSAIFDDISILGIELTDVLTPA